MITAQKTPTEHRVAVDVEAAFPVATSPFASIRKLVAGNGIAQAMQFGAILVLSRLFLPEAFGGLARVQSIGSVVAIVVSLQLHLTVPLSRDESDASTRVSAVETLASFFLMLALLLAAIGRTTESLAIALAVILAAANTYSSVLVFRGRFGPLSIFSVARASLAIGLQITFGLLHVRAGLLLGAMAGEVLSALLLRSVAVGTFVRPAFDVRRALSTIRDQVAFTLFGTLQELISVASFYAPVLLFARYFGEATGGQYAMANRLVFAPVVLLSGSTAQVLYHKLGKSPPRNLDEFRSLLPRVWVIVILCALCSVSFFMTPLFLYVIGDRWELASRLIPLQALWGTIFLLSTPARVIGRVRLLQREQLVIDCLTVISIAISFLLSPTTPLLTMWRLVVIAALQNLLLAAVAVRSLQRARSVST